PGQSPLDSVNGNWALPDPNSTTTEFSIPSTSPDNPSIFQQYIPQTPPENLTSTDLWCIIQAVGTTVQENAMQRVTENSAILEVLRGLQEQVNRPPIPPPASFIPPPIPPPTTSIA
ncbi:hypothetical protein H0H87_005131, partial [Tephrocybe sp. NHM501043]